MKKAIIFSVALLLTACGQQIEDEEVLRSVVVEPAEATSGIETINFTGVSKPGTSISISFRVAGIIEQLPVKLGEGLGEGQLIAALEDQDYVLEVQKATATLDLSQAEERNAYDKYQRIKFLYEGNFASRDELDEARTTFEAAKATVEQNTAVLGLSKQNLVYTKIHAPHGGCSVSEKIAEVSEYVAPGKTVVELSCGDKLEIDVAVPEIYITSLHQDMAVTVKFSAYLDEAFEGIVTEVGVVSFGGTTFPVTITLDQVQEQLRPGMSARVFLTVESEIEKGVIIVPFQAVGKDEDGNYLYLFDDIGGGKGIARRRKVTVGDLTPRGLPIVEGLEAGDPVIIAGVRYLSDGREVKLSTFKEKYRE